MVIEQSSQFISGTSQNKWDAQFYDRTVGFVSKFGEEVLELLAPQKAEEILDLGCGTGHLTAKIAQSGAKVQGIDHAASMIAEAQRLYPHLEFNLANAESFSLPHPVEAVFSNAALHWMRNPQAVISNIAKTLKPGGRFVGEMGAKNNVTEITTALYAALREEGCLNPGDYNPWYFPSVAEYATLLEENGFTVTYMIYFDRPTPLENCPAGVGDWLRNFGGDFAKAVAPERWEAVLTRTAALAEPNLFRNGQWLADYTRLRFRAVKK